jgi:putative ABC transport system permease protein
MVKTWLKDALRNIKKRIVSWLSIVTIVLIGTTLILGLFFASSTVKKASASYISGQNFKDFDVSSSMGITGDDIEKIKKLDEVNDAEGQITFQGVAYLGEGSAGITILSVTDRISIPTVMEGTMPSSPEECIVSYSAMGKLGAVIGDVIEISVSSSRFEEILPNKKYKITGVASHPDYMVNISTDYAVLPLDSFDTSGISFDYSNVLVDADITEDTFKSGYKKKSTQLKEIIEAQADSLLAERAADMSRQLDAEYENAKKTAEEELGKGKKELDDGKKLYEETIASAEEQLAKGEEELGNLKETAEKELSEAKRKIKEGEEEYNAKLADGQTQLENAEKDMERELNNAKWQLFDGFLKIDEAEKLLNEKEKEYAAALEKYKEGEGLLKKGRAELDEGWETYNSAIDQLDGKLNSQIIGDVANAVEALSKEEGDKADVLSKEIKALAELSAYDRAKGLLALYDKYVGDAVIAPVKDKIDELFGIDTFREELDKLAEGKEKLDSGEAEYASKKRQLDDAKELIEEGRKELDQGWYSLGVAKKQLAEGEAEYARREPEARKQLEDAKKEFEEKKAEGAKQLEDAKKTLSAKEKEATELIATYEEKLLTAKEEYKTQKEDGEKKLAEASQQYEDAKKEADDKLAEFAREIESVKNTSWSSMVRTRDVNFPFVQTKSYIKAIDGFFGAFTPLYAGIIAIVCFFTMTIIIEEQTSQIGTCKAFGMYESEIMRKYIVFGATGALFGALAGVAGAFAIEKMLMNTMKGNLAFSLDGTGHNIVMIVLLPLMEVLITVVAVVWSCHRYIRCSAVGLISGSEPAGRYRKKGGISFSSIYSNLIISNLLTDIGREIVSVVVIVMCVFIVGFGIDIKMAYEGALKRQMNDIWQYDITLTESGTITEEEKEGISRALEGYDALYLPVTAGVITDGESQVLTSIICVDNKEEFGRFYVLKDPRGKKIGVFDDGVLVTKEMQDKNGLNEGSVVNLIGANLSYCEVDVKGIFVLYAGKTMIMTGDYYREKLGADPVPNTYYIKASGIDEKELKDSLSELPGVSSVELTKNLRDRNMAVVNLYNAVVVIVILFSVMLSFMILLNLSNILVAHRMREILTMRVNGFSNGQVIGYLAREVLLTGVLSVVIALAIGMPLTSVIIKNLETDAFMFVRQPFALAWIASVLVNVLFSVTINFIAFRKVNMVALTDINKY